MADVLLLHHAQGQTPGFLAFADALRAAGHTVHAPDLYAGQSFATLDEGMANARSIGFGTLHEQGVAAAEELPEARSMPGSPSASWPPSASRRPGPGHGAPSCSTRRIPLGEFAAGWPAGRARCRSTAARPTSSSWTRATSTPPGRSSRRPRTASSSRMPAAATSSPTPVRGLRPGGGGARATARPRLPREGLTPRVQVVSRAARRGPGSSRPRRTGCRRGWAGEREPPLQPEAGPGGCLAGSDVADLVPELEPREGGLARRPSSRRAAARGW